jgi:hypothetical protein
MNNGRNLEFLDMVLDGRLEQYKTSKWLKSDFDSSIWNFNFGKEHKTTVDFSVCLADGSLLTDKKNSSLLKTFKYWINASVHHENKKGRGYKYSDLYARQYVFCTLTLIDYFLLNDESFHISSCGLTAISEDNIKQMLDCLASNKKVGDSIYNWPAKLSEFLMKRVAQCDIDELNVFIQESDINLESISDDQKEQSNLRIPYKYIPLMRAWLLKNDLMIINKRNNFKLSPSVRRLSNLIYKNTLRGYMMQNSLPLILCVGQEEASIREKVMISTNNENNESLHSGLFTQYKASFKALRLLHDPDLLGEKLLLPPIQCLQIVDTYKPEVADKKRFKTLPSKVVFYSIRKAIEFHLMYGELLLESFINLLEYLSKSDRKLKNISQKSFIDLMCPELASIGVRRWSLLKVSKQANKAFYFKRLRANEGLAELIRVYFGATATVVGALMARRQADLLSLKAGECIDSDGEYLIFEKSKSTSLMGGMRRIVARPIDGIAVDMINILELFQDALLKYGYINQKTYLFSHISTMYPGMIAHGKEAYNGSIDLFCDYFETPLKDDARYYLRQHQLRRFFAMCFFWGSGFSDLDTLRWFFGHTDPEHLYNYITESCPGEILKSVKAQYATETIESHANLSRLIKSKYKTDDFTILEESELQEFIEDLIEDGKVEVEPEFFDGEDGKKYRIIVKVMEKVDAEG